MRDFTEEAIELASSNTFRWSPGMMAIDEDGVTDRVLEVFQLPGFGEMIRCEHITYPSTQVVPDLSDQVTRAALMGVEVSCGWEADDDSR
tara:strand:- start:444 stop:713 length:270 start_codon:yes stop_codon:yes gene_type:complete